MLQLWSQSLELLPDETVIEDSSQQSTAGVKPTYSAFLTNKRVVFRFDGFGSSLAQSFTYDEITVAHTAMRMFISCLGLRTGATECFLPVPDPEHWASRILDTKAGILLRAVPPLSRTPTGRGDGPAQDRSLTVPRGPYRTRNGPAGSPAGPCAFADAVCHQPFRVCSTLSSRSFSASRCSSRA